MSRRPTIGIICQTQEAIAGQLPPCWIMGQRYVQAIQAEGGVPWLIPLLWDDPETLRAIFDRLDGLFLTGGVDVDPSEYGETRQSYCGRSDPPRDRTEHWFIEWCLREKKPLFAVCRGLQIFNVVAGGTLYQDLSQQVRGALKHDYFPTVESPRRDYLAHTVEVEPGTRLREILRSSGRPVNSMHHQAIKTLGRNLQVSAVAPDGVIEGIEAQGDHFAVAVQWHPEELMEQDPAMRRLFGAFLGEARRISA